MRRAGVYVLVTLPLLLAAFIAGIVVERHRVALPERASGSAPSAPAPAGGR
jgi:hypothetical protein